MLARQRGEQPCRTRYACAVRPQWATACREIRVDMLDEAYSISRELHARRPYTRSSTLLRFHRRLVQELSFSPIARCARAGIAPSSIVGLLNGFLIPFRCRPPADSFCVSALLHHFRSNFLPWKCDYASSMVVLLILKQPHLDCAEGLARNIRTRLYREILQNVIG